MIEDTDASDLDPPEESSRFVILTSGTTGTPKGAQRGQPETLSPLASMFSRIPLKADERTMLAAPMFHSWGFAHFLLGMSLTSTYILQRKFDPEETLKAIAEYEATALVVVPVMMQRILQLPEETLDKYDLPSLRVTAASGSALPGQLAEKWMDHFGDNLYNLYGSTEVAWATIATPEDLRAAPGTAGLPPRGTVVKIVDERGQGRGRRRARPAACSSATSMAFEGYTGGGGKDVYEGLLSSGDVGHFDDDGRLFIDGRDDEMIVSGGENVFPREVEDLLAGHDDVKEVAVIGVDDDEFGQRLKAFVVLTRRRLARRGRRQGLREGEPRPLQGPARGRVPRLAAAQRHRQGPQARAHLRRNDDAPTRSEEGNQAGSPVRARQEEREAGRSFREPGRGDRRPHRQQGEGAVRESRPRSRSSTDDISSGRRGGKRSGSGPGGRTREQLYNEAKKLNISGARR